MMSTHITVAKPEPVFQSATHASFLGTIHGEFLKIARLFWMMLIILTAGFLVAFLLNANAEASRAAIQHTPLQILYTLTESNLVIVRILGGIFLLILTSFVVGREYQYGTIRILLARGAGRIRLLLAKIAMLALSALILAALFTLFIALLTCGLLFTTVGNLDALSTLTSAFWSNIGLDVLAVLISMGATILLATAMNALGRSLTFGLSASLIWFPIDNISTLLMGTLARLTHSNFWLNVTSYLLGPLLNRLPSMLLPAEARSGFESFGTYALVPTSNVHALWVISAYALVFFMVALVPTWKRDVKE